MRIPNPLKYTAVLFFFLFASTLGCVAQFGVYAGFTTSTTDLAHTPRMNGGSFGAFYDFSHFPVVDPGIDLRIVDVSNNQTYKTSINSVTFGPRIVLHIPHAHLLRPYGEVLVGEAHVDAGQGFATISSGSFAATVVGGADLHLIPHLDWRVIDYAFSRDNGGHTYQHSITTGLVLRFP